MLEKSLDDKQKQQISGKIMEPIESLDEDSFVVREKMSTIEKIKQVITDRGSQYYANTFHELV